MTTLPFRSGPSPILLQVAVFLFLALFASTSGCAHRVLRPSEVPAQYQAPPTVAVSSVDLSRLVQFSVGSQAIDRGDVLEVSMINDYQNLQPLVTPVRVGEDGQANIPLIGKIPLAGLNLEDAEQAIASTAVARGVYQDPHITVAIRHRRSNRVTVVGAVKTPGTYELQRGSSSLLAALVAAGGLGDDASPDVEIRQSVGTKNGTGPTPTPQPRVANSGDGQLTSFETLSAHPLETVHINLISATQEKNVGYNLNDGDVVMVMKRPPRAFHVLGLVHTPGQYELPADQEMHVLDAIAKAGGVSNLVADELLIIRRVPDGQEPLQIKTSLREAKHDGTANLRLAPGDVVSVEQTPATFFWDLLHGVVRFGVGGTVPVF